MEAAVSNLCLSGILACHLLDLGHPPKPTPTLQKSGAGIHHSLCLGNCRGMKSRRLVRFSAKEAFRLQGNTSTRNSFSTVHLQRCGCVATKQHNNTHQYDGVICTPGSDNVPGGQATFCVSRSLFGTFPHLLPWDRGAVLIESQEY